MSKFTTACDDNHRLSTTADTKFSHYSCVYTVYEIYFPAVSVCTHSSQYSSVCVHSVYLCTHTHSCRFVCTHSCVYHPASLAHSETAPWTALPGAAAGLLYLWLILIVYYKNLQNICKQRGSTNKI